MTKIQKGEEIETGPTVEYRDLIIADAIEQGFRPESAANLVDFVWTRKNWQIVSQEQYDNIQRWKLN